MCQQSIRNLVGFGMASKVVDAANFGVVDVKRVGNRMRCHFFVTDWAIAAHRSTRTTVAELSTFECA